MAKTFTGDDDALLAELGIKVDAKPTSSRGPREERIIAGFEDIQRFVDEHVRNDRQVVNPTRAFRTRPPVLVRPIQRCGAPTETPQ